MKELEKFAGIWHKELTRRDFLRMCLAAGMGMGVSLYLFDVLSRYEAYAAIGEKRGMREALFYEKIGDEAVRCLLCPNQCTLSNGQRGICRVREPLKGKLYTLVYELICAVHIDPIEKKPLFHVLPGSRAFSIATAGCNSRCKFCQNWTISQRAPEETSNQRLSCSNVTASASSNGCSSIAYTYTEPAVFYEYVLESSRIAAGSGIRNVIVTGGKINPEPLRRLCRFIDAANVDLKAFNDKYLREVCAQKLETILQTLTILKQEGVWVEITNLIVPTLNDNMDDIRRMVRWIARNLGPEIPLHFSRFWPQYKLRSLYPTPVATLEQARDIALEEGLQYVYIGNVPETRTESTICPGCKKIVIKRIGYSVLENNILNGACKFCGRKIAGIWK
ncbi:MAG: AmmeMemoRadiSam system radical SAM enzyme [Candidatus Makaraimicrobium thalassicum]|nr:MAG: AmmeMemoRadiSam system radical SAM enzyme [Candidatus Omnitrophota bacterium]